MRSDDLNAATPGAEFVAAARPNGGAQTAVPFTEALRFWVKLGFISFGGPAGQIAIMHRELVDRRRWISEERFLHALNYCMLLPGPEAQQLAIYIGWLTFLPCFLFIFLGGPYVEVIRGNRHLTSALSGVTAAVVGVVLNLALVFGAAVIWPHALAGGPRWVAVLMGAAAFALLYRYKLDVLWVVLGGGAIGLSARLLFGG